MADLFTGGRWSLLSPNPAAELELRRSLGVSPLVARVLAARGLADVQRAREFLEPSLARDWEDPLCIPGMGEVADRVQQALTDGEVIAVFGDFDVDGMTSTCLLTLALRHLGAEVHPFIPHRFGEGYGLSKEALDRVLEACSPSLIVTVDNGIASGAEVEALLARGIDVVVTDHHEPSDLVPRGVPVTDPKLSADCPSRDLAGAGSYTGFDLELAQETAKRNDWEVQLEPIDWDAKDTLMDSGAINCIWNGFTIEGRENDYSFSGNYMINAQVIVVKKDSGITDFAGLAGKAVITQTDSAAYEVLAGEDADKADVAATFASLETIGDYNTAFMQLESGAVDAVACDLSIAAYQLAAKPDAYAQLAEKLSEEHYAVGFKKGDDATAATVTETLKAMDADGFVKDLCDKYADQGISYENWCLA